jgi:prophage regulatory protein
MTAQTQTTQTSHQQLDRMLRRKEVEQITARSRSAIYEGMAAGTFPKPVKIGARAVAWPESIIRNWIAERMERSRA